MIRALIINEIEEDLLVKQLRIIRLRLRDTQNVFNVSAQCFESYYRLPKHLVMSLLDEITPALKVARRNTAIPHHLQLLAFLSVVANGGYQKNVGHDFLLSLSQTTISRCIDNISRAIDTILGERYIRFPQSVSEINSVKSIFYRKFGFPGVTGAIDCTHIEIEKPQQGIEHAYYSGRKKAHTKNVQIICDYNLKILNINARFGGTAHNSFVFTNSQIRSHLMRLYEAGNHNNMWLIGDSGYEQRPWIMTPIRHPINASENKYNAAHRSARNCIERCNGVLKGRFRILGKDRILRYTPQKSGTIINACAVLHNIMIEGGVPFNDVFDEDISDENIEEEPPSLETRNNFFEMGILSRNRLVAEYFQ